MSAPSAHPQVGPITLDVDGGGRIDAINTILLSGLAGTVRMHERELSRPAGKDIEPLTRNERHRGACCQCAHQFDCAGSRSADAASRCGADAYALKKTGATKCTSA